MGAYLSEFRRSIESRDEFWLDAARAIDWTVMPTRALDDSNPPLYRWFPDGELNTAFNALDRHADGGRGDQPALIWDSAVTGAKRTYSYRELRDEVARFAGGLAALGVRKSDRAIIYMPMVPEAVIAMLACARLGAVHSVVFGGFAPRELAARIDDARPTLIIAASCGIEPTRIVEYQPIVDQALTMTTHQPERIVMLQRDAKLAALGPRYLEWTELMADAKPVDPVPVKATDPLYILYTSGTTGRPKGVVRDAGGHAVALTYSMYAVYDIHPGEVWWTASDVGWVVGHSYICYAPLLIGATSVMYEGKPVGTPDAGAFWRVLAETRAKALFTAPTALRAIKRIDPDGKEIAKYDLSAFRTLVHGRRAAGPGHARLGEGQARRPGDRPLVADRDRMADRREPAWAGADVGQARFGHGTGARLGCAHSRSGGRRAAAWATGRNRHQVAATARLAPDTLERRPALCRGVLVAVRRVLPHR